MSQLVVDSPQAFPAAPAGGFRNSLDPAETEFSYRPIPMSAMVGAVLAVMSISALLAWLAIPVAVVAALICLWATLAILRSQGEFAGLWLAVGGFGLSVVMAIAGVLLTMHRYKNEIPPGYERVSFARDISARGIGQGESNGRMGFIIPQEIKALEGKQIYLKGFMYPTGRMYELTQFVLCKDNAQCCFGGEPALQDMIGVTINNNRTTTHSDSLTGVAGKLRLNPNYHGGKLEPIYLLEADFVGPALTSL